ncbi:hypothetical protein [Jannaschia pohangensis]|uniref:Uncharacterized protein n=1 Tax=Jannaschia pohangensis TaxID=390807 RepID=A0A1I3NP12_9RHOB|nr:hypothetical protein [Jannaschia pohangensis]SFJ11005.1 hypothetical protein SAMN04488095_2209 [Jannaschia pohangensis]
MTGLQHIMRLRGRCVTLCAAIVLAAGTAEAEHAETVAKIAMDRCIATMSAGSPPDVSGLRPLDNVAGSAFSDAAMTPDDEIAVDPRVLRGLRDCQVASDTRRVKLGPDAIAAAKATFSELADRLVADGGFVEQSITGPTEGMVGSFFVEEGDFVRRLASTAPVREGLYIEVSLMTGAYHGEVAIVVSEHFGPPPEEVSLR